MDNGQGDLMRAAGLTAAEKRVRDAFPSGTGVDFLTGDPLLDDPAGGASWGPPRTVRAEVIRNLLLSAAADEPGRGAIPGLKIAGARISGALDLRYAVLRHRLTLIGCSFEQPVSLSSAQAPRTNFRSSHMPGLSVARARIDGDLRLDECRIAGQLRVDGSEITGALLMDGVVLSHPGGVALRGDRVRIGDDLHLREGALVEGTVSLRNAQVGGDVVLEDARLSAAGGRAMDAARLRVGGDLIASRLRSEGFVGLPGAQIAGLLRLAGARLDNPGGIALDIYRAAVGADLQCHQGFEAVGDVHIVGAQVTGHVRFDGATLRSGEIAALDARYAEIGGTANCREVTAVGPVRFYGARVGSVLDLRDSTLTTEDGSTVLFLGHLRAAELNLRFRTAPNGPAVLSHAQVGLLADDPATWPPALYLDGFTCEKFSDPGSVASRVSWLARDASGYQPQPYEHLAAAYRRLGLDGEARRVLLAKQRARRRTLPLRARPWGHVQDAAVGYGYRPERAFGWLAALLAIGAVVFGLHHPHASAPPPGPAFNPLIYTLDLLLPVVDFGQRQAFAPDGGYQWVAYLLTAAGWILATTIAAGVARAVNRS